MNFYDLFIILSILTLLITVVSILVRGKTLTTNSSHNPKKDFRRYLPLMFVFITTISIVGVYTYYNMQIDKDKIKYASLLEKNNELEKFLKNEEKNRILDSLELYKKELLLALEKIKKQDYITGKTSENQNKVNKILAETSTEINTIKSFNEVISKDSLQILARGFISSTVPGFTINCPTDLNKDFLDIEFQLPLKIKIEEVAFIFVHIVRYDSIKHATLLYQQGYRVQPKINYIRVPNYLHEINAQMHIGYILKSEYSKETPRFEHLTCHSPKSLLKS